MGRWRRRGRRGRRQGDAAATTATGDPAARRPAPRRRAWSIRHRQVGRQRRAELLGGRDRPSCRRQPSLELGDPVAQRRIACRPRLVLEPGRSRPISIWSWCWSSASIAAWTGSRSTMRARSCSIWSEVVASRLIAYMPSSARPPHRRGTGASIRGWPGALVRSSWTPHGAEIFTVGVVLLTRVSPPLRVRQ